MDPVAPSKICPACKTKSALAASSCSGCGRLFSVALATGGSLTPQPRAAGAPVQAVANASALELTVYCLRCRVGIPDSARFCPKCGWDQRQTSPSAAVPAVAPPREAQIYLYPTAPAYDPSVAVASQIATACGSLALGVIGLVAWLIPIIGLPITATGVVLGIIGIRTSAKGLAMAGAILSVLGLLLSAANLGNRIYARSNHVRPFIHLRRARYEESQQ